MSKPIPKPIRKKTPDYQTYNHKNTRIECHKRFNYQNWANIIHGNLTGEEEWDNSGELVLDEIMKVKIQSLRDNMYELKPEEKNNQDETPQGNLIIL